jgi:hypothetical protein
MHSSSILSYDNKLALADIVLIRYNIPNINVDSVRMCPMSAKIVRRAAACCPPTNKAAYSASVALATTHGIMVVKQWMSPLI